MNFRLKLQIAVHDKDEIPLMDEVSYGVSPGQETTITVHKHQVKHQELFFS